MKYLKDWRFWIIMVAVVFLITVPLWSDDYTLYIISLVACNTIATVGLDILTGVAGQIVLAHHVFLALGAYSTSILMLHAGLPFPIAVIIGCLITVVLALILAIPALRLGGFELAIVSLGFGAIFERAVFKLSGLTGGPMGLTLKKYKMFGLGSDLTTYWLVVTATILMFIMCRNILRGRIGRAWLSIRDSEVASEAMGISLPIYKTYAYIVSAFLGALSGGFYAQLAGYLSADNFVLWKTIMFTAMFVVGGMASLLGSFIGTIFFTLLPEFLQSFNLYQGLIFGLALALTIGFLPNGLISLPSVLRNSLRRSPQASSETDNPIQRMLHLTPPATSAPRKPVQASTFTGTAEKSVPIHPRSAKHDRTGTPLLQAKDVTMRFGGNVAINKVNMNVYKNEIFGLIGPNGAGKTVLFNCLTGFLRPTEGSIQVDGVSLVGKKTWDITGLGLARTFQSSQIVPVLSVIENVMIGAHRHLKANLISSSLNFPSVVREEKEHRLRAMELLTLLHIDQFADVKASSLSIAHRRLLEVARALMASPRVLLLDEPAAGLTTSETEELGEALLRIRDKMGLTIILIEHELEMVMKLSDHILVLNFGEVIAEGTPAMIQNNPEVIRAYMGGENDVEA